MSKVSRAALTGAFLTTKPFIPPTINKAIPVNTIERVNFVSETPGINIARTKGSKGIEPITTKDTKVAKPFFTECVFYLVALGVFVLCMKIFLRLS